MFIYTETFVPSFDILIATILSVVMQNVVAPTPEFVNQNVLADQGDHKILKNHPIFQKSSPNSFQAKKGQNIYNKAQFENPKHHIKPLLKPPMF